MDYNFDWNFIQAGAQLVTLSNFSISFNSLASSVLGNPEQIIMGYDGLTIIIPNVTPCSLIISP